MTFDAASGTVMFTRSRTVCIVASIVLIGGWQVARGYQNGSLITGQKLRTSRCLCVCVQTGDLNSFARCF